MRWVLICLTLLVVAQASIDLSDGRIAGGEEAEPHSFPFIVGLLIDGEGFCGGTIINEYYILSAAHCLDKAGLVEVRAGAHNISNPNEPGQVRIIANEFIIHQDWSSFFLANDIALVKLPQPLVFDDYIQPAVRATVEPVEGAPTTILGWGSLTSDSNRITDLLHYDEEIPVITDLSCELYFGLLPASVMCIKPPTGRGVCAGDTGGPLLNEAGELVGVSSFFSGFGCDSGDPDAFSSIPDFNEWIDSNIS